MKKLEKLTLKCLFDTSFQKYNDSIALSFVDEKPFTYADVSTGVKAIMNALSQLAINQGDRVAILAENSPNWGMTYMAITSMGAIAVPILPDFHQSEVNHIIRNSGAKIAFVSGKLFNKIEEESVGDLQTIICIDNGEMTSSNYMIYSMDDIFKGTLLSKSDKKQRISNQEIDIEEDDLAEILYTSGTTGHSKGVMLTHKNIVSNALASLDAIDIDEGEILLSILPLAHSFECTAGMVTMICHGCSVYYIKGLPTPQVLLPALEKVKPTVILSVPLIMEKIYKKRVLGEINAKLLTRNLYKVVFTRKLLNKIAGNKLYKTFGGRLKFIVFGGAATQPDVERFLVESKFPYITGYGLTESSPVLTVNPQGNVRFQSCGKAIPGVELKIGDVDSETGIGEILACGPNIMKGYYKNPEVTAQTITSDGWLVTGDRGYLDDDGYLFIKGRSKNIIVGPSGENIYPEEIEFYLAQNSYVLESLVYENEGKIIARVFLDYDALDAEFCKEDIDQAESMRRIQELLETLRKDVNAHISSYSRIHKIIEQQEEFEKTPTKKIKRYLYTG